LLSQNSRTIAVGSLPSRRLFEVAWREQLIEKGGSAKDLEMKTQLALFKKRTPIDK
jgi:hypothetical protein